MSPAVSAVLPVFNGERFVGDAIASVLRQTLHDVELVVVNDGSEDRTEEIVESFCDRRIRRIDQPNLGLAAARNRGIAEASSDLIAFLDADDEWLPCKLEKQSRTAAAGRVVYSDVLFWDDATGASIGGYCIFDRFPKDHRKFCGDVLLPLLAQNFVHPSSVLMHRRDLEAVGGFDESLRFVEDWDLWLRCAETSEFHRLDDPLVLVRRRSDSLQSHSAQMTAAATVVLDHAAIRLREAGRLTAEARTALGLGYFGARSIRRSRTTLLTSVGIRPWRISGWYWAAASLVRPMLRRDR